MSPTTRKYKMAYDSLENFRFIYFFSLMPLSVHGVTEDDLQQGITLLLFVLSFFIYTYIIFFGEYSTNAEDLYIETLMIDYLMPSRSRGKSGFEESR